MSPIPLPEIDQKLIRKTKEFQNHKKATFWQIYFPLILSMLLVLTVVVLVILTTVRGDMNGNNSKWASLILIFFICVVSIFTLVIAAALFYIVYSLAKGIKTTPTYTNMAKFYIALANKKVKVISDAIVAPIIKANGAAKGAQTLFSSIKKSRKEK